MLYSTEDFYRSSITSAVSTRRFDNGVVRDKARNSDWTRNFRENPSTDTMRSKELNYTYRFVEFRELLREIGSNSNECISVRSIFQHAARSCVRNRENN